jgi:histone acetyltransferase (RNA polymerase elongator complex component)
MQAKGYIQDVRCSTRPDCLGNGILQTLKNAGITTVELGVQSFCPTALHTSQRGYPPQVAHAAAKAVQEAGFSLGLQIMAGMPGQTQAQATHDIAICAHLHPDFVRIYPCLVFQQTPLATVWQQGGFTPWGEEETLEFLAQACLHLWRHGIRVARIGVAPEEGLEAHILAGVRHPALGSRARGLALYYLVREVCRTAPALLHALPQAWHVASPYAGTGTKAHQKAHLYAPQRYSGEFWGNAGELAEQYNQLGLARSNVHFWRHPYFSWQPELLGVTTNI